MVGFDYGLKPRCMIIGDMEYPNLLHQAKVVAIGYGVLPHFGPLSNTIFTSLIFENKTKGRECFEHLKKWVDTSGDSKAVVLSFIEKRDGGYKVCIYPEFKLLEKRCIPEYMIDEVQPIFTVPITFPIVVEKVSQNYYEFKRQAVKKPYIFCGASREGEMFLDLAIQKRNVNFFQEGNIPEDAPEKAFERKYNQSQITGKKILLNNPSEIFRRRKKKLKNYFPISIAKLEYMHNFIQVRTQLIEIGYQEWQINQAACNLIVSYRMVKKLFFQGLEGKVASSQILNYLLDSFEEYENIIPDETEFSLDNLKRQIKADMKELLLAFGIQIPDNERALLAEMGKNKLLIETF